MEIQEINKYINQGGILTEMLFDFHIRTNNPDDVKSLATDFCNDFVRNIIESGVAYFAVAEIEPPEIGEKYTSTYAKITILFKSFRELINIISIYTPVSIEIIKIKNDKLEIDMGSLQDILNDLSRQIFDAKAAMLTEEKKREMEEIYRKRLSRGYDILKNDTNRD